MNMSLQFDREKIRDYADDYLVQLNARELEIETEIETVIAPQVRSRQFFTRAEFLKLCHWKSPRSKPHVESNPEEFIQEVTRTALTTPNERLRIEVLTLLDGVSWPTASVLLHFGHQEPYPILDFRALSSLGVVASQIAYDFDHWWQYTFFCRKLAAETGVTMRTLDRALWQFSKSSESQQT